MDEQKVPSMEVTLYRINLTLMNIKDLLERHLDKE